MNRRGILKHWILPEQGLNAAGTKYAYRPTGNRPEYMPRDTSPNKYLIDAVMYHVALTSYLKKDENGKMDQRKFDISTLTHLARCYTRLLEAGFPSSVNIATDVQKVIVSMKTVLKPASPTKQREEQKSSATTKERLIVSTVRMMSLLFSLIATLQIFDAHTHLFLIIFDRKIF